LYLRVLGSAAGGGSPQWNCGCANCIAVRAGHAALRPRTQASAAVSADGQHWFLLNASPDVRAQIDSFPALHPRRLRDTPIGGIALNNGDVDACLGLFILREDQPLVLYASEAVERGLREHNALTRTLERRPGQLIWNRLRGGEIVPLVGAAGPSGLTIEAVPVPGTCRSTSRASPRRRPRTTSRSCCATAAARPRCTRRPWRRSPRCSTSAREPPTSCCSTARSSATTS
jgi:pyrroloquinoline quinone biosynthesis protein B